MFASKISTLSLFVFCLFTLGQAAPVVDDISSLFTREVDSDLVTRGFLRNLLHIHKKYDAPTQKKIDHASKVAHCKAVVILLEAEHGYTSAKQNMESEKDTLIDQGSKSDDPVVKTYEKKAGEFGKLATKLKSKVDSRVKSLKKLGVSDGRTQCKTIAGASSSSTTSTDLD